MIRFLKTGSGLISERYIRSMFYGVSWDDMKTPAWHVSYAASATRTADTEATPADVQQFLKDTHQ